MGVLNFRLRFSSPGNWRTPYRNGHHGPAFEMLLVAPSKGRDMLADTPAPPREAFRWLPRQGISIPDFASWGQSRETGATAVRPSRLGCVATLLDMAGFIFSVVVVHALTTLRDTTGVLLTIR